MGLDPAEAMDESKVFVSYARSGGGDVGRLVESLRDLGLQVWIDTTNIAPTADWNDEIRRAIESNDACVLILSPRFFESTHCRRELEWIRESGKKVIPVAIEAIEEAWTDDWAWLRQLNWIVDDGGQEPEATAEQIRSAVAADLAWSTEHARLLVRAREWDLNGRPPSRLLRGADITGAEAALLVERPPSQPQPNELQRRFVAASRKARGRLVKVVVAVAVIAAVVSSGLAIFAFQQRDTAVTALASAEYRQFNSDSRSATTRSDALRLALASFDRAEEAGLNESEAVGPLVRALGRSDLPEMHFVGLPDGDSASGGRQGVDVSGDGSTLAYATSDGRVHIVDLWALAETAVVEPFAGSLTDYGAGFQVGLDFTGSQVARTVVAEYPEGGEDFVADLEIFDLADDEPRRTFEGEVPVQSPAAGLGFGPSDRLIVIAEQEGTITVVDLEDDEPTVTHLGTPEVVSDASLISVNFSLDGDRVCALGGRLQAYRVDPPEQIADVDNDRWPTAVGRPCIPEGCGINGSVMAADDEGNLDCVDAEGFSSGQASACCMISDLWLAAARGIDELSWPGIAEDSWGAEYPTGDGVAPPYVYLEGPSDLVRPPEVAFVVPGPSAPTLVSVTTNGDIDIWEVGVGLLPADGRVVAEGMSRLLGGQALVDDEPLIGLASGAQGSAIRADARTGEPLPPDSPLAVDPGGYAQSEWLLDDRSVLTVSDEGQAVVFGPDGETSERFDLDFPDFVVFDPDIAVEAGVLAYSSGTAVHVLDAATGTELQEALELDDDSYCAVTVSNAGTRVAAATCGDDGVPDLHVWDSIGEAEPSRSLLLDFSPPTAVALSDDGRTVGVAFGSGEVSVYRDNERIEPPELTTTAGDHNDFVQGWVALAPDGTWMVTQRDGHGLELWHVGEHVVEHLSSLAELVSTDPPLDAVFVGSSVTLSWNSNPTAPSAFAVRWSLSTPDLQLEACRRIAEITEDGRNEAMGPAVCAVGRGSMARPDPVARPEPPPVEETSGNDLDLEATRIPLPEGSFPSVVAIAGDGATWVAASSDDSLLRIDSDGLVETNPIGESSTSVNDLEPAPNGGMWFTGFHTFGWMETDGSVQLLRESDNPTSMTVRNGTVHAFISAEAPKLLLADQESASFLDLDGALSNASAAAMTTADDQVWLALNPVAEDGAEPALGRLSEDGDIELETLEDLASIDTLVTGPGDELWFAGQQENGSGVIGVRRADGEVDYFEPPNGITPWRLAADSEFVWFISESFLGRVEADGSIGLRAVPDAERLSAIALGEDGSIWITDSQGDAVHHFEPS